MNPPRLSSAAACISLALLAAAPAAHATGETGDAARGATVFATDCAECHSVKEGKDKKGPSLHGVFGAKAAQREGFVYSEAMRSAGLTWTPANLAAYVSAPAKLVPGGKMKYDGLADAAQRDDLLAYLAATAAR